MVAAFVSAAFGFSLMHLICVAFLARRTRGTPLFSALFKKNRKRGGYSLRSSYLFPRARKPELLYGLPKQESAYYWVRLSAHGAVASGAAGTFAELWQLLKVGG